MAPSSFFGLSIFRKIGRGQDSFSGEHALWLPWRCLSFQPPGPPCGEPFPWQHPLPLGQALGCCTCCSWAVLRRQWNSFSCLWMGRTSCWWEDARLCGGFSRRGKWRPERGGEPPLRSSLRSRAHPRLCVGVFNHLPPRRVALNTQIPFCLVSVGSRGKLWVSDNGALFSPVGGGQ